jgi:hypothetical protein
MVISYFNGRRVTRVRAPVQGAVKAAVQALKVYFVDASEAHDLRPKRRKVTLRASEIPQQRVGLLFRRQHMSWRTAHTAPRMLGPVVRRFE